MLVIGVLIGVLIALFVAGLQALPNLGKATHLKSGRIYSIIDDNVINSTNVNDGEIFVLYRNDEGMLFVRKKEEFDIKFERIK